jgi:hypothetical protein
MIRLRFASDRHLYHLICSDTCPFPSQGGYPATLPHSRGRERVKGRVMVFLESHGRLIEAF